MSAAGSADASGAESLMSQDENPDVVVCCTCQRPSSAVLSIVVVRANKKQPQEVWRCRKCHALKARIDRVISKRGALVEDWNQVSDEAKRKFYADCEATAGPDLVLKMQETIVHYTRKSSAVKFTGTGLFLDEEDLCAKYATKPNQLMAIKENSRQLLCPIRNVVLFEDVSFSAETLDEETRVEERKRKVEMAPAPDTKKKSAKPQVKQEVEEHKLKAGDKKKLGKKIEQLKAQRLAIMDLLTTAHKFSALIPEYVVKHGKDKTDHILTLIDNLESTIEKGTGAVEDMMAAIALAIDDAMQASNRLKVQVDEAKTYKQ